MKAILSIGVLLLFGGCSQKDYKSMYYENVNIFAIHLKSFAKIIGILFLVGCGPNFDGLGEPFINNPIEVDAIEGSLDTDEDNLFITKWKTDNEGLSSSNQITILTRKTFSYDYDIDWGDGTINKNVNGSITHTYSIAGIYRVKIARKFPQIIATYHQLGEPLRIISIEQWGKIKWKSMYESFLGCENLVGNFIDTPDLSHVENMENMFDSAKLFNSDISDWDVSNVKYMSGMFFEAEKFNQNIENWDVSNVKKMNAMFYNAKSFSNQDLSSWNVSKVKEHTQFSVGWGKDNIEPKWNE